MSSCRSVVLLLAFIVFPLRAADFAWPGCGIVSLPAAAGWSLQSRPAEGGALNIRATPGSGANARLLLTLFNMPPDKPVVVALLKEALLEGVLPQLATAVEKSPEPQRIKMRGGGGWYVQLTDSALVGKPAEPGKFKMVRSAMLAPDTQTLVIATLLFDDPKSPEAAAMLGMVHGILLRRDDSIAMSEKEGRILLTAPGSRIVLSLNRGNLRRETTNVGGGTASPRYFLFKDPASGLNLSGWLEPAEQFEGVKTLWARDRDRMISQGFAIPRDESFATVAEWDVVFYTVTEGNAQFSAPFLNCRAHVVREGTWIELHLSLPESATARERLARVLTDARISTKP